MSFREINITEFVQNVFTKCKYLQKWLLKFMTSKTNDPVVHLNTEKLFELEALAYNYAELKQ